MKRYILIIIILIINILLFIVNYNEKYEIAKRLEIENINDFSILEIKNSLGYETIKPIYIKFKISVDNYNKYNLNYKDIKSDDDIFDGEITNKKQKTNDNNYICYYEKVIYNKDEQNNLKNIYRNMIFLKIANITSIILIIAYGINKFKNKKESLEREK